MTTTTTLARNGTTLARAYQVDGWMNFIDQGRYTDDQQTRLVEMLMDEQEAAFDAVLPECVYWYPYLSEIQGPITATLDGLDLNGLMEAAAQDVITRFEEIETRALESE